MMRPTKPKHFRMTRPTKPKRSMFVQRLTLDKEDFYNWDEQWNEGSSPSAATQTDDENSISDDSSEGSSKGSLANQTDTEKLSATGSTGGDWVDRRCAKPPKVTEPDNRLLRQNSELFHLSFVAVLMVAAVAAALLFDDQGKKVNHKYNQRNNNQHHNSYRRPAQNHMKNVRFPEHNQYQKDNEDPSRETDAEYQARILKNQAEWEVFQAQERAREARLHKIKRQHQEYLEGERRQEREEWRREDEERRRKREERRREHYRQNAKDTFVDPCIFSTNCPYAILGLARAAAANEIKSAYRKVSKLCHPDKVPPSRKVNAEKGFLQIQQAHNVLMDPITRQVYDECGSTGLEFLSKGFDANTACPASQVHNSCGDVALELFRGGTDAQTACQASNVYNSCGQVGLELMQLGLNARQACPWAKVYQTCGSEGLELFEHGVRPEDVCQYLKMLKNRQFSRHYDPWEHVHEHLLYQQQHYMNPWAHNHHGFHHRHQDFPGMFW